MIALRSLLFNVLFSVWTAIVLIACLPMLMPASATIRAGRVWAKVSLAMLAAICGLRHEIRGLANLPSGPCMIASKHQSAWDTLIFPLLVDGPAYVYKRELRWIPLFGWYLTRAGCIPIDRAGGPKALRHMIEHARASLALGHKVIIFPEGTRVAPGDHRPYHPGVAALYGQLAVPVAPVAVNSGLYWGRRSFRKRPGTIILEILPPIAPGMRRREFAAELERRIETASDALLAEARRTVDKTVGTSTAR
jgi:1-acyl-sn-glycerol-3-phosphate acyltransferase